MFKCQQLTFVSFYSSLLKRYRETSCIAYAADNHMIPNIVT